MAAIRAARAFTRKKEDHQSRRGLPRVERLRWYTACISPAPDGWKLKASRAGQAATPRSSIPTIWELYGG